MITAQPKTPAGQKTVAVPEQPAVVRFSLPEELPTAVEQMKALTGSAGPFNIYPPRLGRCGWGCYQCGHEGFVSEPFAHQLKDAKVRAQLDRAYASALAWRPEE